MPYCLYLRKSRADREAEDRGEEETLARHERELLKLSRRLNLNVTKIFREVVSGDTISARPEVQTLLSEVEKGFWEGVLVMEIERLARGETRDQGIVAETFKYSNTKIITPTKTYDPNNEFDQEYFEFGLFMSRREYKTIKRRLMTGRIASVDEGKYIASTAPYGYERVKAPSKGYTLKIVPEQAKIVRLVFDLYVNGEIQADGSYQSYGTYLIAKKLDMLNIKPLNSDSWSRSSIRDMLSNPTYMGMVRWGHYKEVKSMSGGVIVKNYVKDEDCKLVKGLHEAIIDEFTFQKAQSILKSKNKYPIHSNKVLKNPLSGIVKCGKCGATMTRVNSNTKAGYFSLKCTTRGCSNISSPIYLIEQAILSALSEYKHTLTYKDKPQEVKNDTLNVKLYSIASLKNELATSKKQLSNTYDLLEQGVYSTEVFLERNKSLSAKISDIENRIDTLQKEYDIDMIQIYNKNNFIPKINTILDSYNQIDVQGKNELLKEVLEKVTYTKDTPAKKGCLEDAEFDIVIYPKIRQD